ncbi:transglutaminase family protein [Novosphingobium umbonatum]|uniref:Transglutaminase family protein n=1 Tax=Novosphingobium umbonatum TaxID=1908524 RepID=A0A437N662_9SPHN|nr:transglutaminase family protein [Novosphingobium umbonatum]RVU05408.1 transglutaminase family protein [Novosphingobium umbonatum]
MRYRIRHQTSLTYAGQVRLARLNLRLRPVPWPGQRLEQFLLSVTPTPAEIETGNGPWLVERHRITLREGLSHLTIESRMVIEVEDAPSLGLDLAEAPSLDAVRAAALALPDLSALGPASYLYASPMAAPDADIAQWAAPLLEDCASVVEAGKTLMSAIFAQFTYDGSATNVTTTPAQAFAAKRGVCQDFAQVMIVAARAHGLPAAYISGYLRTRPPEGQPRLVGADAMHAWVALWCGENLGWVGFDPTNDMLAQADHIVIGMGRDYADVAPVDGVFLGGGGQSLGVSVDVEPLD